MSQEVKHLPQPERASPRAYTVQEKEIFLNELRKIPNVTRAARTIGRTVSGLQHHRKLDSEFDRQWTEALDNGIDALEAEVHRRAFEGVDKPITFQGQITATFKEYSDTLAMFLLKAHRPDKYRERTDVNVTNNTDLAVRIQAARAVTKGTTLEGEIVEVQPDDDFSDLL